MPLDGDKVNELIRSIQESTRVNQQLVKGMQSGGAGGGKGADSASAASRLGTSALRVGGGVAGLVAASGVIQQTLNTTFRSGGGVSGQTAFRSALLQAYAQIPGIGGALGNVLDPINRAEGSTFNRLRDLAREGGNVTKTEVQQTFAQELIPERREQELRKLVSDEATRLRSKAAAGIPQARDEATEKILEWLRTAGGYYHRTFDDMKKSLRKLAGGK